MLCCDVRGAEPPGVWRGGGLALSDVRRLHPLRQAALLRTHGTGRLPPETQDQQRPVQPEAGQPPGSEVNQPEVTPHGQWRSRKSLSSK